MTLLLSLTIPKIVSQTSTLKKKDFKNSSSITSLSWQPTNTNAVDLTLSLQDGLEVGGVTFFDPKLDKLNGSFER